MCHQVYEESNPLLWSSNIFSFGNGKSLDKFVVYTLAPMQVAQIAKLRIRVNYVPESLVKWRRTLRSSLLKKLVGLRTLHLYFDHDVHRQSFDREVSFDNSFEVHDRLVSPFVRFSLLSVRHVTLIFKDNGDETRPSWTAHWTDEQHQTVAENVFQRLLNPSTTTLETTEKEIQGAERMHQTTQALKSFKSRRRHIQ